MFLNCNHIRRSEATLIPHLSVSALLLMNWSCSDILVLRLLYFIVQNYCQIDLIKLLLMGSTHMYAENHSYEVIIVIFHKFISCVE